MAELQLDYSCSYLNEEVEGDGSDYEEIVTL